MAKRRRLATAAAGIGEGLTDASGTLMKFLLQDALQSRYDQRQAKAGEATLARQQEINIDQTLSELLKAGATDGNIDPAQFAAVAEALGREVDPTALERAMPARRRLETTIGDAIGSATSPEGVPSDSDVIGMARARGVNDMLPQAFLAGDALTDNPFGNSRPEVAELGARAGAKRRALIEKPTQIITRTTPSGAEESFPVSLHTMGTVETKPDAETQGAITGTAEVAATDVAGASRAAQKGKEADAVQDVEMAPDAVDARVREAAQREAATMKAALPYQIRMAQETAKINLETSLDKEHRQSAAAGIAAAGDLAPFFAKVSKLTADINAFEGPLARVAGGFQRGQQMLGTNPKLSELDTLVNQNLRKVAIAMGVREANVSEKETLQALKGLGIGSALSTATERRNGLRNLYDLITIAPVVAAQTSAESTIGERMSLAQGLMEQRREAEAKALDAGYDAYIDPVTRAITKVIK